MCTRWCLLLLLQLTAAGTVLALPPAGKFLIADISVNGVAQRAAMICKMANGDVLVRRDDASSWNLDVAQVTVVELNNIAHINLSQLRGVKVRLDGLALMVDADFSAFQGVHVDMLKNKPPVIDGGSGAYLNYDVTSFIVRGQKPSGGGAVEGVVFSDALSFASSGVASSGSDGRRFVRYETSVRQDFPDSVRSLIVGDAISRSGTLARSFRFGGISYGSNFATRPDMVTLALPTVPGEATIPTAADLLINGQKTTQLQLPPGPFEIANIPAINGAGEIQLVTRDALGRQQVLVVPFYVTPALLRPGLIDAGFEAGKVREDFGISSWKYGRTFARGVMRMGVTGSTTIEAYTEATTRQGTAGAGATMSLGNVTLANVTVAVSGGTHTLEEIDGNTGTAAIAAAAGDGNTISSAGNSVSVSLERSSRDVSFSIRGQYASRHFSQIGETQNLQYRVNASAGMGLGKFGNLSALYATESRYDQKRIQTAALTWQKQLMKRISMLTNFSITRADDGLHHFAGIVFAIPLDVMASASISSTMQDGHAETIAEYRENLPADEGFATRARVSHAGYTRLDAGATWQNNYGQFAADASSGHGTSNMRLGANGSIVFAGGMTRAVRQLGEAFAIVSAPGQAGIDVYLENQRVATTNADGFALIPRLRPYEINAIELNTLKLALSTDLKSPRRTVTPARRGGVKVNFETVRTQGALVRLYGEDGQPLPAGTLVRIGEEYFPVANNGDAWVTALSSQGATTASAEHNGRPCTVSIPAPDKTRTVSRIGPLTCIARAP